MNDEKQPVMDGEVDRAPATAQDDGSDGEKEIIVPNWLGWFKPEIVGRLINKKMAISAPIFMVYYIV